MNAQPHQIIAAQDGGFGNYKIGWLNGDGNIHTAVVPADVGIGSTDLGLLATGTDRKYSQVKPFTVEWDGHSYLVGPNVHRWSGQVFERRTDFQRLGDAPETRPLTYVMLAQMLDSIAEAKTQAGPQTTANGHKPANLPIIPPEETLPHIALVVGFPVEIMEDRATGEAIKKSLDRWLIGPHQFRVNGRPYKLHIDRSVAMAQPYGTYSQWGYRPDGAWGRSRADYDVPVVVGDWGYNTFDFYGMERGTIVGKHARGAGLGLHLAVEVIAHELHKAHGVELFSGVIDQMIQDHTKGRPVFVHTPKASYQVNHIVQHSLDYCFGEGITYMREKVLRGSHYRHLLMAGGTLLALRQPFLQQYPAAYIPADPVTSNADGLTRRGRAFYNKKSMPAT